MFSFITEPEFVISTSIAIFSIIIPIFYERIGRKVREISYAVEKITLSQRDTYIDGLSYKIKDRTWKEISVSDVIIWSSGKEVINREDIASTCPVTIHFVEDVEILEAQIIQENEESNCFKLETEKNRVKVDFEYIAKNQGVAIRVIHTPSDDEASVMCKIKDGKRVYNVGKRSGLFYRFINSKWVKHILSSKWTSFVFVFFTVFLFPHAFVQSANYGTNNPFGLPENGFFMNLDSIIILIMYICSLILAVPHVRNLFKREVPKGLVKDTICER